MGSLICADWGKSAEQSQNIMTEGALEDASLSLVESCRDAGNLRGGESHLIHFAWKLRRARCGLEGTALKFQRALDAKRYVRTEGPDGGLLGKREIRTNRVACPGFLELTEGRRGFLADVIDGQRGRREAIFVQS